MTAGARRRRRERRLGEGVTRSLRNRSGVSHARLRRCCQRESLFLGGREECTQRPCGEWGVSQQQTVRNTLLQRGGPPPPEHTQSHATDTSKKRNRVQEHVEASHFLLRSCFLPTQSGTPPRHHIRRGEKKRTTQRKVSFHEVPSVPFRRLPWLWMQFHVHNIQMQLCLC